MEDNNDKARLKEWFIENLENKRSHIKFKDKEEFYLGYDLHNEDGAAIIWKNVNMGVEYYLFGEKFPNKEEWKKKAVKLSRKEKLKDIFDKEEK
jgi:hypothetical protein